METIRLWAIEAGSDRQSSAKPVESVKELETEKLLEDVLTKHPGLLLPGLSLVGRQTTTATGWLDLMGVDEDGRLVVFELKRGTLARDAIAQVIDYASYLASLDIELLARHIEQRSGIAGIEKIEDFQEWYHQRFPEQPISSALPPRMVLVGLGVDEPTERMTKFLADSELDISLITFHGFQHDEKTLLARQMRVQGAEETEKLPGGSSRQAKEQAVQDLSTELGVSELFENIRSFLRGKFLPTGREVPGKESVMFRLTEREETGELVHGRGYASLYLYRSHPGKVYLYFYDRATKLAQEQFARLYEKFPPVTMVRALKLPVSSDTQWNQMQQELDSILSDMMANWESDMHQPSEEDMS